MKTPKLKAFYIPEHLEVDFDNFLIMGIAALDGMADDRTDWSDGERAIVEWLEEDKYKQPHENQAES